MSPLLHADGLHRCPWPGQDPFYVAYHDDEWGVPEYDDRALYEKLMLDGFQAGLSWITILRKRENFRKAFDGFQPEKIARYTPKKVERLMQDAGIVRNRSKIEGAIKSARGYLDAMERDLGVAGRLLGLGVLDNLLPLLWETQPERFPLAGVFLDRATGLIAHSRYVADRARGRRGRGRPRCRRRRQPRPSATALRPRPQGRLQLPRALPCTCPRCGRDRARGARMPARSRRASRRARLRSRARR